jgi:Protein of unknown function (DUF1822)
MFSDYKSPLNPDTTMLKPKSGEIWEIRQDVKSPIEFSEKLYSQAALRFLKGMVGTQEKGEKLFPRYVMVVNLPEKNIAPDDETEEWQEISVMVLSRETNFISDVDILIPQQISGLEEDLLAETWHVVNMLTCNLSQPHGARLPRETYDLLMDRGDAYHQDYEGKASLNFSNFRYNTFFHQQEKSWAEVLTVPVAAYQTYKKGIKQTENLLYKALEKTLEEEKQKPLIHLGKWLDNILDAGWVKLSDYLHSYTPNWAIATIRGQLNSDEMHLEGIDLKAETRVKLIHLAVTTVALAMEFEVIPENQASIILRLYPTGEETLLPPNLKLVLLDKYGAILREIIVGEEDIYLQLKFSGSFNEQFSVRVVLGEIAITEDFII